MWKAVEDVPVEYEDPKTMGNLAKPHLWIHPEGMKWSDLTDTTMESLERSMERFREAPHPTTLMKTLSVLRVMVGQMAYGLTEPGQAIVNLRDHLHRMDEADTDWPLILSAEGDLMDGRHRLSKALADDHERIRVQRFKKTPPPTDIVYCDTVEDYRQGNFR